MQGLPVSLLILLCLGGSSAVAVLAHLAIAWRLEGARQRLLALLVPGAAPYLAFRTGHPTLGMLAAGSLALYAMLRVLT